MSSHEKKPVSGSRGGAPGHTGTGCMMRGVEGGCGGLARAQGPSTDKSLHPRYPPLGCVEATCLPWTGQEPLTTDAPFADPRTTSPIEE